MAFSGTDYLPERYISKAEEQSYLDFREVKQ